MIKDVMVRLDGTSGDDARLAAASQIAENPREPYHRAVL